MDPVTQKQWNDWAQDIVKRAIDEHSELLIDVFVEYVIEQIKALREEIAGLRADQTIHAGVSRGEIADIRRKANTASRGSKT